MNIENIDVSSYPNSEKIYVDGTLPGVRVAMRKIHQYPTVKSKTESVWNIPTKI